MNTFEWNENIPVTANNLNEMQNILGNNFQLKGEILWQNQNPSSSFDTQTITLENNDCDMLLWLFKRSNFANQIVSTTIIYGYDAVITNVTPSGDVVRRGFTYQGNNQYLIRDGTIGASTTNNQWLVPLYVIGYKTGLF